MTKEPSQDDKGSLPEVSGVKIFTANGIITLGPPFEQWRFHELDRPAMARRRSRIRPHTPQSLPVLPEQRGLTPRRHSSGRKNHPNTALPTSSFYIIHFTTPPSTLPYPRG